MKLFRHLFLLYFIFLSFPGFSQSWDTYQSPAIYKKNHVKSRVMMFDQYKLYARTIDYFDKDGFLKEYMQFDTTGTKVARGLRFIYDSIHRITGETIYENYHFDTSSKKFTLNEKPDTIVLLFIHDTINGLIKKTGKNNFIRYACEYNYKTFTETDTFFLSNGITNIGIAHVDHPFIEKDVKCFSHSLNGDSLLYSCSFKNTFDKSGNIKKRIRIMSAGSLDYYEGKNFYFKEEHYTYMPGGLLINKTSSHTSNHSDLMSAQLFDYKFW